jgi:hypothetical protein
MDKKTKAEGSTTVYYQNLHLLLSCSIILHFKLNHTQSRNVQLSNSPTASFMGISNSKEIKEETESSLSVLLKKKVLQETKLIKPCPP